MSTREKQIVGCSCIVAIFICVIALVLIFVGVSHLGMNMGNQNAYDLAENTSIMSFPEDATTPAAQACLNLYIKENVPTSPLNGKASNFVSSGKQGSVNPALLVAIGQQESQLGTTGEDGISKFNYYGRMSSEGELMQFVSWDNAIAEQGPYMNRMYLKDGLTTIVQIGSRYAPVGASNDPNNKNKKWIPGVTKFYNEITTRCSQFATDSGSLLANATECGNKILAQAAQYNGIRYSQDSFRCGPNSKGPGGVFYMDCSSYVGRVYNDIGLIRKGTRCFDTAYLSVSPDFVEISAKDIKPGDVVRSGFTSSGRKTADAHVVIYSSGDVTKSFYVWQEGGDKKYVHYGLRDAKANQQYFRAKYCVQTQ